MAGEDRKIVAPQDGGDAAEGIPHGHDGDGRRHVKDCEKDEAA